ncbi:uncharacterized protein MKK02DRAFT_22278 [Dioszegia hungarica]|uniref:RNA helicase n=1 Tax=Dioszegia hungarica TaxID=4972 RepID=A0AA38LXX3_9TREE|nr:uncharacterized protein MKK02DRAFT_22278 [Dioszegia hungarica]KAI9637981.1 hypothetical protein MKK02DRAFT_22278 [Dioszegia hungarica]
MAVPTESAQAATGASAAEWETSPMYLALSSRIAKTESTLVSLSAQVAELSSIVKSQTAKALPPSSSLASVGGSASLYSPSDENIPPAHTGAGAGGANGTGILAGGIGGGGGVGDGPVGLGIQAQEPSIAALTQQISALSTSVAQLQRLQQAQSTIARTPSTPTVPGIGASQIMPAIASYAAHPGNLPIGNRFMPSSSSDLASGPMTTPSNMMPPPPSQMGPPLSPIPPNTKRDLAFSSPMNGNRPNINRSMSSSVIGNPQADAESKWGNQGRMGGPGTLQMPSMGGAIERVWSPGGMMTPTVSVNGSLANGPGPGPGGGGAAAPGAGIVVTKWEHLNLKVELLRAVNKYGIGPPNKIQARVLPFMLKGSDMIAQAPPTQERIISYVVPALQLCLTHPSTSPQYRGPTVVIVTTTVDQANQCHKLVRNLGAPLGIRSALSAGAAGSGNVQNEVAAIQRDAVHVLIGTPAKLNEVITARGVVGGSDCRLLILDEVDQLIARNLYENVLSIAKLLPAPKRGPVGPTGGFTPGGVNGLMSPGAIGQGVTSPYDPGQSSPFNPASKTPFPAQTPSRFGAPPAPALGGIERQTCIFSNTIPTDVINFSQTLNVRDPVRVLVRRDGGPNSQESVSSVTPGIHLKHTYVYLTITPSSRSDAAASTPADPNGIGTIGSGRAAGGAANQAASEEANRAKEYKLDILGKMLDDYPLWQAIIHVGSFGMLEAVVYKLQSRNWETLYLTPDMPPAQKKAVLQSWRTSLAGNGSRFLVVFDVNVKPPDVPWSPLVINFDLPRSVEGYAARAAAAVSPNRNGQQVNGVIVSFVQAAGGDVEMLRSTECAYRFKSAEVPSVFHDLFQH